jgi:hypothetical protein
MKAFYVLGYLVPRLYLPLSCSCENQHFNSAKDESGEVKFHVPDDPWLISSGKQTGRTPQVYLNTVMQNKNSATARNSKLISPPQSQKNPGSLRVSEYSLQILVESTVNITRGPQIFQNLVATSKF